MPAMDSDYVDLLKQLIESGKLNNFELNAFTSMIEKGYPLSFKQRRWVDRKAGEYLKGFEYNKDDDQTDLKHCCIEKEPRGYQIYLKLKDGGRMPIGRKTSKREGKTVMAWLDDAIPTMFKTPSKRKDSPIEDKPDAIDRFHKNMNEPVDEF